MLLPKFNHTLLAVLGTWLGILWHTKVQLRRLEETNLPPLLPHSAKASWKRNHPPNITKLISQKKILQDEHGNPLRFLVFQGDLPGQGAGNLLNGLLATHLLADEFQRIVCVSPAFEDFLGLAYEAIHPLAVQHCPKVFQDVRKKKGRRRNYHHPPRDLTIEFVNFGNRHIDECDLRQKLQSDIPVWYLRTNMYPRWPSSSSIPKDYFDQFYRPSDAVRSFLPTTFPSSVVHLRQGDNARDVRRGLDNATLEALGEYLKGPKETPYLVTNHVEFYHYFEARYHWSHSRNDIGPIVHSALFKAPLQLHPEPQTITAAGFHNNNSTRMPFGGRHQQQKLQLWADWYTLLKAKTVYHTFSDFSASAVHWTDPTSQSSRILKGYNATTNSLELAVEVWRRQPTNTWILPLSQRTPQELLHCTHTSAA